MIVPVVKRQALPSDDAIVLPPESSLIDDELVGDIFVLYAFDLPGHFQFVSEHDRKTLGLDRAGLRSLAVRNLTRLRGKPEVLQLRQSALMLKLGGELEASLLLVDHLWSRLARSIAGDTVVAVPSRDVLIVSGTGITGGVETLRAAVKIGWERRSGRKLLLTRSLLVRRGKSWRIFESA